jgi:hypothetical protein
MSAPRTEAQARRDIEERIKQWLLSDAARPGFRHIEMADALDAYRDAIAARVGGCGKCEAYRSTLQDYERDIANAQSRAEQAESALAEAKREGAREALTAFAQSCIRPEFWRDNPCGDLHKSKAHKIAHELVNEFSQAYPPAPTPASVTLVSNAQFRVTHEPDRDHLRPWCLWYSTDLRATSHDWRGFADTGADFDALKRFAATVGA